MPAGLGLDFGGGGGNLAQIIAAVRPPEADDPALPVVQINLTGEGGRQAWVYGFMTGMAYLEFVCDIFGVDSARRRSVIQELAERLEMVDALADRADSYSHGMLQKLVVMGALVHDPDFLVLDEPFVGLDPVATRTLRTVLQERAAQGKAVLFSSHVLEVVERLCDSVAIIQAGQLRAFGPIDQVLGNESLEDVFMDVVETHEATAAPAAPVRPSDAPQTPFS